MGLDHVRVVLPVVVVEMFEQLALRHDDAGTMHQVFEDAVLHGREIDEPAVALDRLFERIQLDAVQSQHGGPRRLCRVG